MTSSDNVIRAFSAEQVERIAGLTPTQLREWDRIGFFRPTIAHENRRSPYSRIYDFRDVVGLRTLSILRRDHKVPMNHLKDVARELSQHSSAPFSELVLYVFNRRVQFHEPQTGKIRGVVDGQFVAEVIPLKSVRDDVKREADKLRERTADQLGKVERHRYIAHNAWVVAGTRIPIAAIRRFHEAGYSVPQILKEYPSLTRADVVAALEDNRDTRLTA